MEEKPVLNQHNKAEYPPMHTAEHILNGTMVKMFGCGRAVSAHVERTKSKLDYDFPRALTAEEVAAVEARVAGAADIDDANRDEDDRQGIGDHADQTEQRFAKNLAKIPRCGEKKVGSREDTTGDQKNADTLGCHFVASRFGGFFSAGFCIACFGSQRCIQSFLLLQSCLSRVRHV